MEEGFWFKSDLFQIHKGEDKETNPGCYGKELGKWLCKRFREKGYDIEDLIAEDWGWCAMLHRKGYLSWIACGSMVMDDFLDNYEPDFPPDGKDVIWYAYPVVEVPFYNIKSWLKKLIGQLDTELVYLDIKNELKSILHGEPRIEMCEEP